MSQKTWCLLFLLALQNVAAASLQPYSLECEARVNPIGIDSPQPQLSWKLASVRRGDLQAGYEILAASTKNGLTPGAADLWRTGRIASPQTLWILYRGQKLKSFQTVWWKVRVWSVFGEASEWSDPATWTQTLTDPADRKGGWISASSKALTAGPMPIFRRSFTIDKVPTRAIIAIAGLGSYELSINGEKVGDHVLAPAWTNYRKSVRYDTYDVTSRIKVGTDVLGVMLGNGPFNVVGGRYSKYTASFGAPRLWAQLHLEFDDHSTSDLVTDNEWRVHAGPITFSDFYGGEDYNAALAPDGWDRSGSDDSAWDKAGSADEPGGELLASSMPPIRIHEEFRAQRITQPKPGIFVYDLGQNFSGWPKIVVSGAAGSSVKLIPGELLDASGLVSQQSSGGPFFFTYTLAGGHEENWEPRFTYYGFRYVQVEGAIPASTTRNSSLSAVQTNSLGPLTKKTDLPVIHELDGQFIYLDVPTTGNFQSSSKILNQIHGLITVAMKSNLQQVLTDCPHREKLGWLEQSYLMGPSLLFDFDLRTFLPKVMRDIREAQTNTGLIPDIAPEYVQFTGGFRDSPEWGSAGVMLPWLQWQYYGDRASLAAAYPSMKAYVDYLANRAKDGILNYGLGDWYDIAPGAPGPSKLTPSGLTSTATYFADLQVVARAAALLGFARDVTFMEQRARYERQAFRQKFYSPQQNTYTGGSQTAIAMALMTGLAAESDRKNLLSHLISDIRSRDNHTSAGDIGYRYVIEALTSNGRSDLVYEMARQKTPPSYLSQLAAGATSLTEAWDANPTSSQNHLMLGHLEEWFYRGLAGIEPILGDRGGISLFRIDPSPVGDLEFVSASWETNRGPVKTEWNIKGSSFTLLVDLPPGTSASVILPTMVLEHVSLDGKLLNQSDVLRSDQSQDGRCRYRAESGHYEFRVSPFKSASHSD